MFNSRMLIVAFDNLAHWSFNGREGLNATGVRILNLTNDQIMKIVGGVMRIIRYDPNDHYHFNAALLVAGVIVGIILGFIFQSILLLILVPVISQYRWLLDELNRIIYSDQIEALNRLTNSAKLVDKRDNYTIGRYRNAVNYTLDMTNKDYYLLSIDANGVTNTLHLQELATEVGAAFHHSANLESLSNGVVVYKINLLVSQVKVSEDDF